MFFAYLFLVFKAKYKVFGLGCAKINTRENNVNGRCAKINPRENKFYSRTQGARKLIRAKISTIKVYLSIKVDPVSQIECNLAHVIGNFIILTLDIVWNSGLDNSSLWRPLFESLFNVTNQGVINVLDLIYRSPGNLTLINNLNRKWVWKLIFWLFSAILATCLNRWKIKEKSIFTKQVILYIDRLEI